MAGDEIVMYGTTWCGDCKRARALFDNRHIPYRYIDIGADSEAAAFVMKVNRGYRSVPTIVFPDGSIMVEPSMRDLTAKVLGGTENQITLFKRRRCLDCLHRAPHEPGEKQCTACTRLVRVLDALEIVYRTVNVDEDAQALARLGEQGIGAENLPMVLFPDGVSLPRPTIQALARKLNI